MPPKSKKIVSKDESSSSSESEVSEKEVVQKEVRKPSRRIVVAKKDKEESKKKVEIVADKWNEISDDEEQHKEMPEPILKNVKQLEKEDSSSSSEEEITKKSHGSFVKRTSAKYTTSSINFDYGRFRDDDIKLSDLSTEDLIKAAIVRSHDANQYQLGKVLKQTLRAMKLECDFPIVGLTRDQMAGGKPKQYSNNYGDRTDRTNGSRTDTRTDRGDQEYRGDRGRNNERGTFATRGRSQSRFGGVRRTESRYPPKDE